MPEQMPKVTLVLEVKPGDIFDYYDGVHRYRYYERKDVGRNQWAHRSDIRSWTMDQPCYDICKAAECDFCVYDTPDGVRYATFDHVWRSVTLHKIAGLKRYPKVWLDKMSDLLAVLHHDPEPEYEEIEVPPQIDWEA